MNQYERRSAAAWTRFQAAVADLGGTVLEGAWKGNNQPHLVRCANGHVSGVRPGNVQQGRGICDPCGHVASRDGASLAAQAAFATAVEQLGGKVREGRWDGVDAPYPATCAEGHDVTVMPANVLRGQGLCRVCRGKSWNAFYVVQNLATATVKFGVTSGDPKDRLGDHARDGFTNVVRLAVDLPGTVAPDLERHLKFQLRVAGVQPVRGHEYFPDAIMNLLLSTVDSWLTTAK